MALEYTTPESLAQLSVPNPELEPLFATLPPPPKEQPTIEALRAASATRLVPVSGNTSRSQTRLIPMRDGYESEIRIYKSPNPRPPAETAVVVLIYGGAFFVGNNSQLNAYARTISELYGATVVSTSYRLAPEYRFPYAFRDTWDSVKWVAENASLLDADPAAGFVLGGISAGANLSAAVCQKAIKENLPQKPTGLWLASPFVLMPELVPHRFTSVFLSREQNAYSPLLNKARMDEVEATLHFDIHSPEFSPFNVDGAHVGMPPTHFQVDGFDPLRDDGLVYERVLREHAVPTRLSVYPGCPHGFVSTWYKTEIAQKWEFDMVSNFGWLLGKSAEAVSIKKSLDERHLP